MMKKYVILLIIVVIIISSIVYASIQIKVNKNMINYQNSDYIGLLDKEINSSDLASLINKTINKNKNFNVETDEKGYFKDNGSNSIQLDVKFIDDNGITLKAEQIEKSDINTFVSIYTGVNFKCTRIDYHEATKLVKYVLFEEQE